MDEPLSNEEIVKALGVNESYITTYAKLSDYATIEEAFGDKQLIIILIEDAKLSKDGYVYNNSYGKKYDWDLSVIGNMKNKILGNERNTIASLLGKNKCEWNHVPMQGLKSETCGRYVCVFAHAIVADGMNMKQYQEFMLEEKKRYGSYDKAVVTLTSKSNSQTPIQIQPS
jgi:hypothetical protein